MEALETSKRFQLGVGPIRGLHWILCNIISHRCQSCLGLPLPPPPTCSCSSLLATQFSHGQLRSKVEYFYFLFFSFVCFIAREFEIPSSHMKKSSTKTFFSRRQETQFPYKRCSPGYQLPAWGSTWRGRRLGGDTAHCLVLTLQIGIPRLSSHSVTCQGTGRENPLHWHIKIWLWWKISQASRFCNSSWVAGHKNWKRLEIHKGAYQEAGIHLLHGDQI